MNESLKSSKISAENFLLVVGDFENKKCVTNFFGQSSVLPVNFEVPNITGLLAVVFSNQPLCNYHLEYTIWLVNIAFQVASL